MPENESNPMTTAEANRIFCRQCGADPCCDCVLSATCSFYCTKCGERIWFHGSTYNVPDEFHCPYCGSVQTHPKPHAKARWMREQRKLAKEAAAKHAIHT